ncbi:MAG: hypothetical protein DMF69_06130 [Acidobacteria bacterium]|nr:MAG: hypothetical protein DMF69_06130 [Acidobacteriota bacterium]
MSTSSELVCANAKPSSFLPGEMVEVLSETEILATLDENGTLEKLPFMPEMRKFCGKQFRISRQAFKTCVDDAEMREFDSTVFLEEVRCDGASHGGCGRACLIFWKSAWVKKAGTASIVSPIDRVGKINAADLESLAHRGGQFFCQSTEILNASKPLPWWEPTQYVRDLTLNRISIGQWIQSLFIAFYNKIAYIFKFKSWRFVAGSNETFNEPSLDLKPGELVRVKSLAQIKQTLDGNGKNNNLLFAPTMLTFCGQVMRVQDRVDNIILEATTKQRKIKDTVLLEGATCDGVCHRLCPRQSFLFWRECWLERV